MGYPALLVSCPRKDWLNLDTIQIVTLPGDPVQQAIPCSGGTSCSAPQADDCSVEVGGYTAHCVNILTEWMPTNDRADDHRVELYLNDEMSALTTLEEYL